MTRLPYCLAVVAFAALVLAKYDRTTGFTSLIRFGESWETRRLGSLQGVPVATVHGSNGYDGQFYAQVAFDPSLRDPELREALDAPAYRSRRILMPAVASLLGWGNPSRTLNAFALLNVAAWLAFAALLFREIGDRGTAAFARWFGCVFSLGVLESVRQSLVDLPALVLILVAIQQMRQSHRKTATLSLACAALTKEASLLSTLGLCGLPFGQSSVWKRNLASLACAALPLALWAVYVQQRFGSSAPDPAVGNFTWPLAGMLEQTKISFARLRAGDFDGRYSFALVAILGLIVQTVTLWRHRQADSAWWRIGALHSILLFFLGTWVWSGYWAACRALLPLTIAFNLLLPVGPRFWIWWGLGNLTLLHGIWRFL